MLYLGNKIVQYNEKFSTKDNFDIQSLDDKNLSLFSPIDLFHISELNNFQNDENKFYKTNTHNTDERNNIKMRILSNSNNFFSPNFSSFSKSLSILLISFGSS